MTPKNTPPLKPTKLSSFKSSASSPPPTDGHRRTSSAPVLKPPFISIEDATQALTEAESSDVGTPPPTRPAGRHARVQRTDSSSVSSSSSSSPNEERKPSQGNGTANGGTDTRKSSVHQHRIKRSPNVGWKKKWDAHHDAFKDGRVLIVDCYSRDFSDDGKRKTAAYEFADINELIDFYGSEKGKGNGQCLRIVHVQNAVWARDFLLKKFNISSKVEDVVGTAFGRWVRFDNPQLRAGKPVLNAKSFRCIKDPWRGVSRTGFVADYLKSFKPGVIKDYSNPATKGFKLMELNHWDRETGTTAIHGYDVYVQRLSVYIQRNEGSINLHPLDTELRNPYIDLAYESKKQKAKRKQSVQMKAGDDASNEDSEDDMTSHGLPRRPSMPPPRDWESKVFDKLTELDNGNTIILFESSHTGNSSDTMIQAREEIEVRWRRLMLYLNKEEQSEEKLAMELMDLVLRDVFNGLRVRWEKTLSKCEAHVNILEDKVYENPADESRAPELWSNSAMWLKLEQLITLHTVTVKDLQQQMRDLSDCEEFIKDDWVRDTPADLERIADQFDQEMVKPTANLSDLLYKSVEIRDSRHSLQLGLSMWRLSWITFIFLPLTFMGTIFGMNVDIFQPADGNFPGLKWYFIISIPFMILIIIVYIFIKSSLSASVSHDIPLQRGVYEQIYNQFAEAHPHLWSELGPKSYVKPRTWVGRLQWRLVKRWFKPERTIARRGYTEIDEMGLWARIKHSLASRWLRQLKLAAGSGPSDEEYGSGPDGDGEFSTVTELLQVSMPVEMGVGSAAVAGAAPRSPPMMRHLLPHRSRRSSSESQPIGGRNASPGSEMMVEEEKSDDEASGVSKEKLAERKKRAAEKEKQAVTGAETGLGLQRGESEPGLLSGNFLALPFGRKSDDRVEKS